MAKKAKSELSGEIVIAIAAVLREIENSSENHDIEQMVLTIKPTGYTGSPWSLKSLSMNQAPLVQKIR